MGTFDPKLQSDIRPMPVQQAYASPLAVGITGLLGAGTDFLNNMGRGGSGGGGGGEPPWDQLNGLLGRAKKYREEGREDLARKQEVQAWNFATAAGFPVSSSGFSTNWSMQTGGQALEDAALTPEERNRAEVRDHADYGKYSRIALFDNPNATQEEIDNFASKQIALDETATFNSEKGERDFHLYGKADLQRRVALDVKEIQALAAQDLDGKLTNEEAAAFGIQIDSVIKGVNEQRPAGITDDEWNEVIGPLQTIRSTVAAAEDWTSAENVSKRQLSALWATMDGMSPASQTMLVSALKTGDFQNLAILLEQIMPEDAADIQEAIKSEMATTISKAFGINGSDPKAAPTVEGTNSQTQRVYGGSESVRLDSRGIPGSKDVFGTDTFDNGKSAEENLGEARSLTKGIKAGNLTDTNMLANLSLSISKDVMEATSGPGHDGRYIDGVDAREIYDGSMTAAIDTVGTKDPKTASRMAAGHVLALDRQADIATKQVTELLATQPWAAPIRDKKGIITGFGINKDFIEERAIQKFGSEIAGDVMGFLRDKDLMEFFREELDPLSKDIPTELRFYLSSLKDEVTLGDMEGQIGKQLEDIQFFRDRSAHFSRVFDNYAQTAGIFKYAQGGLSVSALPEGPEGTGDYESIRGFNRVRDNREFMDASAKVAASIGVPHDHLLRAISFETGGTFNPKAKNPGSTATGLIQFLEATAKELGTSTAELAKMSATEQLPFVEKYLSRWLKTKGVENPGFGDLYAAIHYPAAVGKDDGFVLYKRGTEAYDVNSSLDSNGDGTVTKGEAWREAWNRSGGGGIVGPGNFAAEPAGSLDDIDVSAVEGVYAGGAPEASQRPVGRPEGSAAPETSPRPEERPFQPTEEQRQGLREMGIEDAQIDMMLRGLAEDEANEVITQLVEGRRSKVKVEKASRKDIDSLNMRQLSQIRRLGGDPEQALFLKDQAEVDQAIASGQIEAGQVIVLENGEVMLAEDE